jgi:hypothetical protein
MGKTLVKPSTGSGIVAGKMLDSFPEDSRLAAKNQPGEETGGHSLEN